MRTRVVAIATAAMLALVSLAAAEPAEWPGLKKETIGNLGLGASVEAATKVLGQPSKQPEAQEEGATGEWVSEWAFADGAGAWMSAPKKKGPFTVRAIELAAPSKLKTLEGIGIGSSSAEIKKAYGKYVSENGDGLLVGTVYGGVAFTLQKDKVVTIFFGPMAE